MKPSAGREKGLGGTASRRFWGSERERERLRAEWRSVYFSPTSERKETLCINYDEHSLMKVTIVQGEK